MSAEFTAVTFLYLVLLDWLLLRFCVCPVCRWTTRSWCRTILRWIVCCVRSVRTSLTWWNRSKRLAVMFCSSKSPSSGTQSFKGTHTLIWASTLRLLLYFRDALSDLALHFLNKMKIMVVKDIEREDIEFICKVTVAVFSIRLILGCC